MNKKEFFIISFTVFLTVLAWVLADIYHTMRMKNLSQKYSQFYNLDFQFEGQIFDKLRQKNYE